MNAVFAFLGELIRKFEGLRLKAYLCPAGVPTVGYGHTRGVQLGQTITPFQAEELMQTDMSVAYAQTILLCPVLATAQPAVTAAIVDFTFNLGAGRLKASTLRRKINAGEWDAVPTELRKWRMGGGKVLAGLAARRAAEVAYIEEES